MDAVGRRGAGRGGWDDPGPGRGLRVAADVAGWGGPALVCAGFAGIIVRVARLWHVPWWQLGTLIVVGLAGYVIDHLIEAHIRRAERFLAYRKMLENPNRAAVEPGSEPGALRLLSPLRSPVPFRDREDELARLRRWCAGEADPHPVLLLAGDRGVGTSRLALELARTLGEGWTAGRLLRGTGPALFPALRGRGRPALVVVDEADIRSDTDSHLHSRVRTDVVPLLRALPSRAHDAPPVRLLFVVRHAERFRTAVSEELAHRDSPEARRLIDEAPVLDLAPPALDRATLAERHAEAVAAFTAALGRAPAVGRADLAPAGPGRTPLDLHAAALVTALAGEPAPGAARRFEDVAEVLFAHELRRWRHHAASFSSPGVPALPRLSERPDLPELVMLTLLLTGHREYVAAAHVIERLPAFAGLERERARGTAFAWVSWALALHGGTPDAARMAEPWIGPESFAHWFLTTRLRADPELFDRLQPGLDARRSEHLAGLLCRACEDFPEAGENLRRYVARSPLAHGYHALRGARVLARPERVDPWIAEGLRTPDPDVDPAFATLGTRDLYTLLEQARLTSLPRTQAVLARMYQQAGRADDRAERTSRRKRERRERGRRT
ncbi:hypothetical protein [Streptomyces monashensis]|uniref:Uncharacterized protein n=1 Tax=Streptomyces monashensis TaxID=1678012 RepID=A0A1S2QQ74_9ACTN|nr:hypothetical protein [Streptomyces monashensis]OIK07565.1 hypothetical protein BIV23_03410 [Streptomyces monashensis]